MQKIKIKKIIKKKGRSPIVCLTAYTKNIAKIADKYCDIILVGDSLGMVLYGMKTTRNVKIETMMLHAKAVKKVFIDYIHLNYFYCPFINRFRSYIDIIICINNQTFFFCYF